MSILINKVKLSKFNGELCENLYADVCFIEEANFSDITNLYNRVYDTLENKNWLKFRDELYLKEVLSNGGFIVGCYVEDTLVASAMCEIPNGDYLTNLYDMNFSDDEIDSIYVSGYVMVDPLYRGNSLHKILLESRINESTRRGKTHILTAVAIENIYSQKTILSLGFDVKLQRKNEHGIKRNILLKQLDNFLNKEIEITA